MNEWAVRSDPSLADEECGLRKKQKEKLLASYERRIDEDIIVKHFVIAIKFLPFNG